MRSQAIQVLSTRSALSLTALVIGVIVSCTLLLSLADSSYSKEPSVPFIGGESTGKKGVDLGRVDSGSQVPSADKIPGSDKAAGKYGSADAVNTAGSDAHLDDTDDQNAAVVFNGKRLYVFNGARDGFSAKERAQRTTDAINRLSRLPEFDPNLVQLKESADGTEVVYGDRFIATMTLDDAKKAQSTTQLLASEFAAKLRIALSRHLEPVTAATVACGLGVTLGASILMLIVTGILGKVAGYVSAKINKWNGTVISGVRIQKAELLSASSLCNILHTLNKIAEMTTFLAALYVYLIVVFNSFPGTRWLALALRDTALVPLTTAVEALVGYLPKAMAIIAIAILTCLVIAFADFFFNAIKIEQISFSGFDP